MNDRDRLAADLHEQLDCGCEGDLAADHERDADRLIALGWTNGLDEERLARAQDAALYRVWDRIAALRLTGDWRARKRQVLDILGGERAGIAKAYREETDATD